MAAPAQSAIKYETVTFNDGSEAEGEQSPYLGISDAADAAWNELDFGMLFYSLPMAHF